MSIFDPNTMKVVHKTCSALIAHMKVRQCSVYQLGTVLGEINDGNDWESLEFAGYDVLIVGILRLIYLEINSLNVSTNIGAKFLRIIDTCFPKEHTLNKIINRNTIKVSYRCMPNMGHFLSKHHSKIANQKDQPDPPPRCS